MGLRCYLAMTGAEFSACNTSQKTAWMACHFSPWGTGLSNLPTKLPPDSLVILDDSTPFQEHDPVRIAGQLASVVQTLKAEGVLLDLQRECPASHLVIDAVLRALTCPVAVTEQYARDHACAVFLSPAMHIPLKQAAKPWQGRQLWLDIPMGVQRITVREDGCHADPVMPKDDGVYPHADPVVHCHYRTQTAPDHVCFTLTRTAEDRREILREAEQLGFTHAVSLYQECCSDCF